MCTDEQHHEKMAALSRIETLLTSRGPIDDTILVSDTQVWQMDYRGRKHVFMWCPTALTLNLGEYGTGPIQPQVWINLALSPSVKLMTSGQSTPVPIKLRFTDEVIP